ncbi:single-stranded DNA-binding protein [Salmonella enterica]|nr:single-stranded DNA-binding protein [Salmonella enterica]
MNSPQNFLHEAAKNFCVLPWTDASGRGVYALAAKVLKRVKLNTRGNIAAGSRKRQYRGSRNSTGDVL